jgi:hypothetical protein
LVSRRQQRKPEPNNLVPLKAELVEAWPMTSRG